MIIVANKMYIYKYFREFLSKIAVHFITIMGDLVCVPCHL